MNYSSLIIQIEKKLLSLNKKEHKYYNIKSMPEAELKSVIDGLKEKISISKYKNDKKHSGIREKYDETPKKNTLIVSNGESSNIVDQTKIHNLEQNDLTSTFVQMSNQHDSQNKINSLSELFEKYKSCQKCVLGKTRKKLVFGMGLSHAPIIFIGEGPGADEDIKGEPFVGRAGRLLTKMINSIGIERNDVYITNIVKCRPPENRNPTPAEISCCLPIIKQQIEILNPKLIVTLGNIPTRTLIPDLAGITKVHGKLNNYEKWMVLPTFHPSYLLRNRSAMPHAWEDFKKITELVFTSI